MNTFRKNKTSPNFFAVFLADLFPHRALTELLQSHYRANRWPWLGGGSARPWAPSGDINQELAAHVGDTLSEFSERQFDLGQEN